MTLWFLLAGSYLLGSLPFGLWIARAVKGVDIRTVGSGNIGATNVWRTCGPRAGVPAFVLDVFKGVLPTVLGTLMFPHDARPAILAGLLAIVGHNYSVWLRFQGGKGIATSVGVLAGVAPRLLFCLVGVFGAELLLFQFISLGGICAALAAPPLTLWLYPGDKYRFVFTLAAAAMAIYRHRANIKRLLAGTEPRVRMPWQRKESKTDGAG